MPEKREINFFVDNIDVCNKNIDNSMRYACQTNENKKQEYYEKKREMDTFTEKYEDMNTLFSREIIGAVNMSLGIGILIVYLYYNK